MRFMTFSSLASVAIAALGGLGALTASTTDALAKCSSFRLLKDFSIKQNNGFAVTIHVNNDGGALTGSAHYGVPQKIGEIRTGSFDGRELNFRVNWSGGGSGNYEGSIKSNGKLVGVTRGGGGTARYESIQTFKCA
jgi:hypothetical protein